MTADRPSPQELARMPLSERVQYMTNAHTEPELIEDWDATDAAELRATADPAVPRVSDEKIDEMLAAEAEVRPLISGLFTQPWIEFVYDMALDCRDHRRRIAELEKALRDVAHCCCYVTPCADACGLHQAQKFIAIDDQACKCALLPKGESDE